MKLDSGYIDRRSAGSNRLGYKEFNLPRRAILSPDPEERYTTLLSEVAIASLAPKYASLSVSFTRSSPSLWKSFASTFISCRCLLFDGPLGAQVSAVTIIEPT